MTPSSDIEQYRPGFEAAARRLVHVNDFLRASDGDGYRDYVLETYWQFWIAAKRESVSGSSTSTSQGARPTGPMEVCKVCNDSYGASEFCFACKGRGWVPVKVEPKGAAPVDALDAVPDLSNLTRYAEESDYCGGMWVVEAEKGEYVRFDDVLEAFSKIIGKK